MKSTASSNPRSTLSVLAVPALLLVLAPAVLAGDEAPSTLAEALKQGDWSFDLRYRFETVSDDAVPKDAYASTLRTALSYRSKAYKGTSLFVEFENVAPVGDDDYRNLGRGDAGSNGVTDRPVVADPEFTEVNQAYLSFTCKCGAEARIGRQELVFDNHRFVGNVGWRQNHQSFDGLSVVSGDAFENVKITYAFIHNVNRIFGDNLETSTHLLNSSFQLGAGNLVLFANLLDFDDVPGLSTATYGGRFNGARVLGGGKLLYDLSLARQLDYGDNPADVDTGYYNVELGFGGKVTVKAGIEVLEGGPGGAFTTPLATLHKFNGWADKFLATPADGLEDLYLHVGGKAGKVNLAAIYHELAANEGSADYGRELDFLATYKTKHDQVFGLKAALYDADTFSADTDKLMVWTAYKLK